MNSRNIQVGILILLIGSLLFTGSSAFAYWREVTVANTVTVSVIREGVDIDVTDLNDYTTARYLVPKGHAMFVGDTESVVLTYTAGVTRELLNVVDLHIFAHNVTIGGDDTYAHLVDIEIMGGKQETTFEIFNDVVTITVIVRLIEPIDAEEALEKGLDPEGVNVEDSVAAYHAMVGEDIRFTLRFELRNKTESNNEN